VATIADELQRRDATLAASFFKMASERNSVFVGELGDFIAWEEQSLWPLACSGMFQQVLRILDLHIRSIQKQVDQLPGVSILSEYPVICQRSCTTQWRHSEPGLPAPPMCSTSACTPRVLCSATRLSTKLGRSKWATHHRKLQC
jgi:hypothetical protein